MKIQHHHAQNASSWDAEYEGKTYGGIISWDEFNKEEIEHLMSEQWKDTKEFLKAKAQLEDKWNIKLEVVRED